MFYNLFMNTSLLPTQFPIYALICAAGVGARAGGDLPKQYQLIHEQPMLWHTIKAFADCPELARVYVVISPNDGWFADSIAPLIDERAWSDRVVILSVGGESRAESVRNGLAELDAQLDADLNANSNEVSEAWVMVHDAARPCVRVEQIVQLRDAVWTQAEQIVAVSSEADEWRNIGGILALPVTDTIKQTADGAHIKKTIDRSNLWAAQTPQMFTVSRLYNALCDALTDPEVAKTITDEASVMEWSGFAPLLVQGESSNLKVTYPQDFDLAGFYLSRQPFGSVS